MDFVRLRGEEHRFSMPVKMILYSLEAAQELMVAVRDLRRTVRAGAEWMCHLLSRRSTWAAIDL